MKTFIIVALTGINIILVITRPHVSHVSHTNDKYLISLTVNRILHEQVNRNWPQAYGDTLEKANAFENSILEASKQHITDWSQLKR